MTTTWLVTTQSGLRWVYQQATPYLPAGLNLDEIEGRLIGPIKVHLIEFRQDGTFVQATQLIVDLQFFKLFAGRLDIESLELQSLTIALPPSEKSSQPLQLPEIHLPWRVTLKNVVLNGIHIRPAGAVHVGLCRGTAQEPDRHRGHALHRQAVLGPADRRQGRRGARRTALLDEGDVQQTVKRIRQALRHTTGEDR